MIKGLVLGFAVAVLLGLAEVCVLHFISSRDFFKSVARCFVLAVPIYVLAFVVIPSDRGLLSDGAQNQLFSLLNGLLMLFLFFITGVHFYYHAARSISLRLLLEFGKATDHALTVEQLEHAYGIEEVVQHRIDAMVDNGFLRFAEGQYYLTPKGKVGAFTGLTVRKLIRFNFQPI
jgi:hypothetical protein